MGGKAEKRDIRDTCHQCHTNLCLTSRAWVRVLFFQNIIQEGPSSSLPSNLSEIWVIPAVLSVFDKCVEYTVNWLDLPKSVPHATWCNLLCNLRVKPVHRASASLLYCTGTEGLRPASFEALMSYCKDCNKFMTHRALLHHNCVSLDMEFGKDRGLWWMKSQGDVIGS